MPRGAGGRGPGWVVGGGLGGRGVMYMTGGEGEAAPPPPNHRHKRRGTERRRPAEGRGRKAPPAAWPGDSAGHIHAANPKGRKKGGVPPTSGQLGLKSSGGGGRRGFGPVKRGGALSRPGAGGAPDCVTA